MKKNMFLVFTAMAVLGFCFLSFAFTTRVGGDSYSIFLNDKQVVQYYVASKQPAPGVKLDASALNDQISIYFNECGKIGTARALSLRDSQNKILKAWTFADATGEHTPMTVTTKEIHALASTGSVSLFYQSDTITKGLLLANVTWANRDNKASR